jgi:hydrogenase nickel incorporation protein HypB
MRKVSMLTDILEANDVIAAQNRQVFDRYKILALNLMSSPGAGKTTVLEKTVEKLKGRFRFAVIEGDVATSNDARRLAKYKIPVVQITTETFGGACHLDANMVQRAMQKIDMSKVDILFIENIGNLICPAEFDLGEHKKVIVLSLTEGEDKPSKYPVVFRTSNILLVNKIDLQSHLDLNMDLLLKNTKKINPKLATVKLSAKTGEGLAGWTNWLEKQYRAKSKRKISGSRSK